MTLKTQHWIINKVKEDVWVTAGPGKHVSSQGKVTGKVAEPDVNGRRRCSSKKKKKTLLKSNIFDKIFIGVMKQKLNCCRRIHGAKCGVTNIKTSPKQWSGEHHDLGSLCSFLQNLQRAKSGAKSSVTSNIQQQQQDQAIRFWLGGKDTDLGGLSSRLPPVALPRW